MNIVSSAFGHYEVIGDPADADVLIGHSFGTSTDESSVNGSIAKLILWNANNRPIVTDRMLANAFPDQDAGVDHVVEGAVSGYVGQDLDSWKTLVGAKEFMKREDLTTALMIGQAHHIGRVVRQAKKLGIDSIVPAGLPDHFDPDSD